MATYNTGNPLGSTDARDLNDNAQNFDKAINSTDPTFNDRLGNEQTTLAGFAQKIDSIEPTVTGAVAQVAELVTQAENAADSASGLGNVYKTMALAQAAITAGTIPNNGLFSTISTDPLRTYAIWQNVNGTPTAVIDPSTGAQKTYPSGAAVDAVAESVGKNTQNIIDGPTMAFNVFPTSSFSVSTVAGYAIGFVSSQPVINHISIVGNNHLLIDHYNVDIYSRTDMVTEINPGSGTDILLYSGSFTKNSAVVFNPHTVIGSQRVDFSIPALSVSMSTFTIVVIRAYDASNALLRLGCGNAAYQSSLSSIQNGYYFSTSGVWSKITANQLAIEVSFDYQTPNIAIDSKVNINGITKQVDYESASSDFYGNTSGGTSDFYGWAIGFPSVTGTVNAISIQHANALLCDHITYRVFLRRTADISNQTGLGFLATDVNVHCSKIITSNIVTSNDLTEIVYTFPSIVIPDGYFIAIDVFGLNADETTAHLGVGAYVYANSSDVPVNAIQRGFYYQYSTGDTAHSILASALKSIACSAGVISITPLRKQVMKLSADSSRITTLESTVGTIDSSIVDNGILPLNFLEMTLTGKVDDAQVLIGQNGIYSTGATYTEWYKTRVDLTNASNIKGLSTSYNLNGVFLPALVIYNTSGAVVYYIDNTLAGSTQVDKSFDIPVTSDMSYAIVQYRNTRPNLYVEINYSQNILKGLGERVSDLEADFSIANLSLMVPQKIYTVANDIDYKVLGQLYTGARVALKRLFNASIYLDNFIQYTNVEHSNLRFDVGNTSQLITPYSPVITAGAIENPNLNGGNNTFEETISYGIVGNSISIENHTLINRSVLNSASKDKTPTILIIGDSVSFGQNAYFSNSNAKWNYTMILNKMFKKDKTQNGGTGYGFRTVGTISFTDTDGDKSYNEAYSGTTLQGTGLFTNPKFLDGSNVFSFNNWLTKYRTCNANGDRLYFNNSGGTTGTAGSSNTGYLANGSDSGLLIGSTITNTLSMDVYEPTHVFCFHCSNAAISKADYDLFISRVRASFPNAIIGLGTPHVAGTYFPSKYPNVKNSAIWGYDQTYNNRQVNTAQVLINNYWDSTTESNKIFVLPTMWVTPAGDAFSCAEVNDPFTDITTGGVKLMPVGQRSDVHVGSKAQAAYAYQLYSWLKWTAANNLF
ncbi:hypothetical protein [Sodalis ligni]|uniref:Uncharacterized protein n=1 Tax=Sodalis ligni TaxID=2697027 RepID=A0A4R1NIL4_9GAMM|nr:hypothetical protein [Sodalis ligni]TCL06919.1 hypothetical protein EZJ58_5217 [Sodalis ligni]